jgi:ribosomal protein S20
MVIWTKQKQALHDKMCDTMIVTAETDTGFFRTNDPAESEERIKKQLDALDGLRKKGILSEQEYRESKSKLMSQQENVRIELG